MTKLERLNSIYAYLRNSGVLHTQKQFADIIGSNKSNLSSAFSGDNKYLTDGLFLKIESAFPNIFDSNWLKTGEGEMLKTSGSPVPVKGYIQGVPYYNVDFIGGFDLVVNDQTITPEYLIDFKEYNKATCWCNITGHSMEPEINSGDIIALKEISDPSFLPFGEIYAIITTNGMRTIKRIGPSSSPDCYSLIPTNKAPEYGIQEIPKSMLLKVYEVLGCMKKL